MKTVFNNDQVAHVWAAQTQDEGRASRIFFEGPTIYSYGRHFPIARFVTNKKGARVVLFTTRGYSVSTSRHISLTREALRGLNVPVFNVEHVDVTDVSMHSHKSNLEAIARNVAELYGKASRARTNVDWYLRAATDKAANGLAYAKWAGVKAPKELTAPRAVVQAMVNEALERQKTKDNAHKAKLAKIFPKVAELWRAGLDSAALRERVPEKLRSLYNEAFKNGPTMLRVLSGGKGPLRTIETSRGARVSYDAGMLLLRCWLCAPDKVVIGAQVGPFTVSRSDARGMHIGCHELLAAELQLFAKSEGLRVQSCQ